MIAFRSLFLKRLLYLSIAWIIISLIISLEMKLVGYYDPALKYSDWDILIYILGYILMGVFIIIITLLPFFDWINSIQPLFTKISAFIIHAILFGLCNVVLFAFLIWLYSVEKTTTGLYERISMYFFTDFHHSIKNYLIFIGILLTDDYFTKNILAVVAQKDLENEINIVKLQSLKAQLQPHFLFNALNNVVALIDENQKNAQQVLIHLSDLLRYTVYLKPQALISLMEEKDLIKKYLAIEQFKYEEQLSVQWIIGSDLNEIMIPPLIAQPLIENAIKHGFKNHPRPLQVVIDIQSGYIEIRNNGQALAKDYSLGEGITIVQKRLELYTAGRYSFQIFQQDQWVISKIGIHAAI